jgi:hypothetical protein
MTLRQLVSAAVFSAVCLGTLACGNGNPNEPTPVCSYTLSPSASTYSHEGGTGTIGVTTTAGCAWTAAASAGWIAISSGSSGTGSGSIAYSVPAHTAPDARTATISVSGQTHTVTQQGRPATVCSYEITPASVDIPIDETRGSFEVIAPADCQWSAASNAGWLTVAGGSPGTGNGTVSFLAERNRTVVGRVAAITVADKTFTVRQNGDAGLCQYSVAPVTFDPCMPASTVTATVTAPQGCTWEATPNAPWLSVPSGSSGTGTGSITIAFTDNYDAPRDGLIMVRWPTPTAGQNIRIAQAGCQYAVSQGSFAFATAGGAGTFDVFQQAVPNTCGGATQDRCVWSPAADVPWITIGGSTLRRGDDRVAFTVAANTTGAARVGRITVRDKVVVITQAQ